ncbi:MAG: hypothetical protein AB1631_00150 [Acidobacteriota bacterium]
MAKKSLKIVRDALQVYADRGVFRGLSEIRTGVFSFVWLTPRPVEFVVDAEKRELRFKNLLPNVAARSAMYRDLKKFLRQRYDEELPPHRRVDAKRAEIVCNNRGGRVSLALRIKNNQWAYGVNKAVNLVHEVFVHLREREAEYLIENFDVSDE